MKKKVIKCADIIKCADKKLSTKELKQKVKELEKKIQGFMFDLNYETKWKLTYYAEKCDLEKKSKIKNEEICRLKGLVYELETNKPDVIELEKQAIIDRQFIREHSKTITKLEVKIARDYDSKLDKLTVEYNKYKLQSELRLSDIDNLSEEMSVMECGVLELIKQLGKR